MFHINYTLILRKLLKITTRVINPAWYITLLETNAHVTFNYGIGRLGNLIDYVQM